MSAERSSASSLILHERLRIVEQAADQRGFAVIDTAARIETQDIDGDLRIAAQVLTADGEGKWESDHR